MWDAIESISIQEVLTRLGFALKGKWTKSPFNQSERTPSCSIDVNGNQWYCFSAHKGGGVVNFWAAAKTLPLKEAYADLCKEFNIPVENNLHEKIAIYEEAHRRRRKWNDLLMVIAKNYEAALLKNDAAQSYIIERGLKPETIVQFGVGYSDNTIRSLLPLEYDDMLKTFLREPFNGQEKGNDPFKERLMFPIRNICGDVLGFTGRKLPSDKNDKSPKYLHSAKNEYFVTSDTLYGIYEHKSSIKKTGVAWLVEGTIDVLALAQIGISALSMFGKKLSERQASLLSIAGAKYIHIFFDNDKAGQASVEETVKTVLRHDMIPYVICIDTDGQDPADWVKNGGQEHELKPLDAITLLSKEWIAASRGELGKVSLAIEQIADLLGCIPDNNRRRVYASGIANTFNIDKDMLFQFLPKTKDVKESTNKNAQKKETDDNSDNYSNEDYEEHRGCTFVRKRRQLVMVAKFTMTVLFWMRGENGARVVKFLHSDGSRSFIKALSPDDFDSAKRLNKILFNYAADFVFTGNDDDLKVIRSNIFKPDVEKITVLDKIGQCAEHDFWVWENGIYFERLFYPFDKDGFVVIKDEKYSLSETLNAQKMGIEHGGNEVGLSEWFPLFFDAYGNKSIFGLTFLIASLFKDIIVEVTDTNPLFFLEGQMGSGKDSFSRFLMRFFGRYNDTFTLAGKSSISAMARFIGKRSNIIADYNEYFTGNKDVDEMLKMFFDNRGRTLGIKDKPGQTINTEVASYAMIKGEQMPSNNPALLSRCVVLSFNAADQTNTKEAFLKLETESLNRSYTSMLHKILDFRPMFKEMFREEYRAANQKFREYLLTHSCEMPPRGISNIAILIASAKLTMPLTRGIRGWCANVDELENLFYLHAISQFKVSQEISLEGVFWTQIRILMLGKMPVLEENIDYKFTKNGDLIVLEIDTILSKINQHRQRQGATIFDLYQIKQLLNKNAAYANTVQKINGRPTRNCFRLKEIEKLYNISLLNLRTEGIDGEELSEHHDAIAKIWTTIAQYITHTPTNGAIVNDYIMPPIAAINAWLVNNGDLPLDYGETESLLRQCPSFVEEQQAWSISKVWYTYNIELGTGI